MTRFRNWFGAILVILAGYFGWNIYAADNGLSWLNPNTFVGGGTIPAGFLTTNRIYRKKDAGAYAVLATIPVGTSFNDLNLTDGVYCYQVTVLGSNGVESPKSNEACKTVDSRQAGAPSGLTIN